MKVFLDTNVALDFLLKSGADILLTRNVADYAFDGITIATPKEFINNQNDR